MTEAAIIGRGYLIRYRVLAFTTAALLIVLVFVGIPLQLLAGRSGVVNVVGTVHGFLYLVYLVFAFQLARKLAVPKWQMFLILLAGTVPFCAFVAERKLTKRYALVARPPTDSRDSSVGTSRTPRSDALRRRWLSRRALLLHLEVLIVAPGCAAAGWWQATRALAGNGLSWFYSVEWPIFAVLAVVGWWRLVHEDPDAYRVRKAKPTPGAPAFVPEGSLASLPPTRTFDEQTARMAARLAVSVGVELVTGVAVLLLIRPSRPSGLVPAQWPAVYLVHAVLGVPLTLGAALLFRRVRDAPRISRLSGWIGLVGIGLAGAGGLLTEPHALRLFGMVLMFLGTILAMFGYLFPTFERLDAPQGDRVAAGGE